MAETTTHICDRCKARQVDPAIVKHWRTISLPSEVHLGLDGTPVIIVGERKVTLCLMCLDMLSLWVDGQSAR
jgi:hypothetical protein